MITSATYGGLILDAVESLTVRLTNLSFFDTTVDYLYFSGAEDHVCGEPTFTETSNSHTGQVTLSSDGGVTLAGGSIDWDTPSLALVAFTF